MVAWVLPFYEIHKAREKRKKKMKKLIAALTGLVTSPSGLGFVVLLGVVLFNLINTQLPQEYFGAVAIGFGVIILVVAFAAICEVDNSSKNTASSYNNLPNRDDDILSKTRDITSTWYESDTTHI